MRDKGVVTIPQEIRNRIGLATGDQIIVTVDDGRIVLTPAQTVPRDHPTLRAEDIPLAPDPDADKAAGRGTFYATDEAFLASFDEPTQEKA